MPALVVKLGSSVVAENSGELRLSNFLLWQAAYSELVFTECLWPEFGTAELDAALAQYAQRERRFGAVPSATNDEAATC